jgi:hypothetical protein
LTFHFPIWTSDIHSPYGTTFNAESAELAELRGVRLQPDWKKSA